jgi:hypothetical protein
LIWIDELGIDVLVRVLGPLDRADVEAGLVGEGRRADVRRLRVERPVEHLGDVVAHRGQALEPAGGQAVEAELELQVRDDGRQVGVARALAEAVEGALHLAHAGEHGGHGVGDGTARVVMAVDAERGVAADVTVHRGDDLADLVRQAAAVRVAQHEVRRPTDDGGFQRPQRDLGVVLVAVEEVLEVDHHPPAGAAEEAHRVADHRLALVERGLQRLEHVVVPALGDDAHRLGAGVEQVAQRRVVVDLALRPPGGAERDERRRLEAQLLGRAGEELDVLRVGAGPAALDVVDAEVVQLLGDAQLVLDRGRHALDLHAVAQRRVEDLDAGAGAGALAHDAATFPEK